MKVRQVKESGRYGSSNPDTMSPGNYDRFQQDQMDYGKREFKRREMEHELGHEDEQQRKEQSSTYYIRINGKLLKNKEGQPYQFRGKEAANKAAVTMMSKPFNRDKKFTLTTTASDRQDNPTPESSIAEMDGAPGQILAATGDKVTIDNKDGTQTIAPKASLTRDPTGKGFVLSKTPAPGGEKPDEPKPGETVFKPATTEGIEKMNEAIRMLRLAGLHKAADRLMEQQLFENPWEGKDPAKAQAWASMSPADQKWLGGADPTDQYILARAPNKGKAAAAAPAAQTRGGLAAPAPTANAATPPPTPAQAATPPPQKVDPNQADRDDAEQGAAMTANAELDRMKQLAGTPTAADQDDADMGAAMKANQAAAIGANQDAEDQAMGQAMTANAAQSAALASGAQDDATGVDKAVAANAAAPAPAPTQAASPAAAPAKTKPAPDPKVMALQQELIRKGAKIKADGIMGPATTTAQKDFGGARDSAGAYRGDRSDMKPAAPAARPGANQPAPYNAAKDSQAANVATAAKPAGGQAASPTAAPAAPAPAPAAGAPAPSLINRFRASRGLPTSEDVQYYEELDKMLTIAKLR